MSRVALIAAVFLSFAVVGSTVTADEAPQVTRGVAKLLKAADEARQAKNYTECIAKAKEASAVSNRSAYDNFVINSLLMAAYAAQGNTTDTVTYMEQVIDSPFQQAAGKAQMLKYLMSYSYQQKSYDKAIQYAERVRAGGDSSEDVALVIAQANFLQGKYRESMNGMEAIVARAEAAGRKPSEKGLNVIWSCALKLKDDAASSRAIEKLILHYPKPDYWQNAMAVILQNRTYDDRVQLMTYRLMNEVGILKRGGDYRDMAQIALDQGNPGEAQAAMEQAFAKNLYTEPRDKESNQRLLDTAKRKAQEDRANLARSEKEAASAPTGDAFVQIGGAYLGYGQTDKALAAINAGIAKGKLKFPDEAYLLLGIAQERAKNNAEAIKAFNKATADPKYARLAKLWALEART
jgi:Tetratricopeptide repeat